ncbi:MAG: hypothetical protein GX803_06950 [Lentisphaerae bacterium]|nr:hypothetical protein [Lentisphaerota bacterium]
MKGVRVAERRRLSHKSPKQFFLPFQPANSAPKYQKTPIFANFSTCFAQFSPVFTHFQPFPPVCRTAAASAALARQRPLGTPSPSSAKAEKKMVSRGCALPKGMTSHKNFPSNFSYAAPRRIADASAMRSYLSNLQYRAKIPINTRFGLFLLISWPVLACFPARQRRLARQRPPWER